MPSSHNFVAKTLGERRTHRASLAAMLTALLLVGCGEGAPEVAPVSGRVTLAGNPVTGARLRFQPEASGGSPSYGSTDQDGRYKLGYKRGQEGALIGWHTVRIESKADRPAGEGEASPPRNSTDSTLRREVKLDVENVFDFELGADK